VTDWQFSFDFTKVTKQDMERLLSCTSGGEKAVVAVQIAGKCAGYSNKQLAVNASTGAGFLPALLKQFNQQSRGYFVDERGAPTEAGLKLLFE
jgi:hypothetical protein